MTFEEWKDSDETYKGVVNPRAVLMLRHAFAAGQRIAAEMEAAEVVAEGYLDQTGFFIRACDNRTVNVDLGRAYANKRVRVTLVPEGTTARDGEVAG